VGGGRLSARFIREPAGSSELFFSSREQSSFSAMRAGIFTPRTRRRHAKMPREGSHMIERQLAFAGVDHRTQVAAPPRSRERSAAARCCSPSRFSARPRPLLSALNVLRIVFFDERAKQIKIVRLVTGEIIAPQGHCVGRFQRSRSPPCRGWGAAGRHTSVS